MKKITIILFSLIGFLSCQFQKASDLKLRKCGPYELRQLVKTDVTSKKSEAHFFLIMGSFKSTEEQSTFVQVFAKVEGRYRLINMPIYDIRIVVDNKLKNPYLEIEYKLTRDLNGEDLLSSYNEKIYVIYCPDIYLPEKLLPITL